MTEAPAKSEWSEFVEGICTAMMDPRVQLYLSWQVMEFGMYGEEALAFRQSCETKDYTLLWEEWDADKAEFARLVAEHQKRRDAAGVTSTGEKK